MKRPKILISADSDTTGTYIIKSDLLTRLRSLGADFQFAFYDEPDLSKLIDTSDGVLVPGSPLDVPPESYGEKPRYENVKPNRKRFDFEYKLLELSLQKDKPLLCICWGFQSLNVFLGGDLYQDLPRDFGSDIQHEQESPSTEPVHSVILEKTGKAKEIWKMDRLEVNSTHHQGIRKLGKDLVEEARSPDGLIESYRHSKKSFVWGVEWHPERLKDDPVIPSFLKACQH